MKLQPDQFDVPSISGYGPGWISVDGQRHESSVVLGSRGEQQAWGCDHFSDLGAEHFALLAELAPELVVFGSGARLRFPRPEWTRALMARGIGVETMDTQAACRTYNILAGEGRHVIAALLLETTA